jgi:glycerol-3-phosphate O-acyltransferase
MVEAATVPLAARSLDQPAWVQAVDGITSALGYPYRFFVLGRITLQVLNDIKASPWLNAKKSGSALSGSKSGAAASFRAMLPAYVAAHVKFRTAPEDYRKLLNTSLTLVLKSILAEEPFPFEPHHKAIRGPDMDYYQWGNDFFRPMVKYRSSRVDGIENVKKIERLLASGENVMLIANHQTEADPQVLSILLGLEGHEGLAEQTVFVAGHKVTTDPLAVPFSMGRNLLTIFSKKYLDTFEDDELEEKLARNRATVAEVSKLFKEGGNCFWVAPSGGRDRRGTESGIFEPAKFDESSVGLFHLLAKKAAKAGGPKTHFFPLAMWTHRLVPPPDGQKAQVGEGRSAARAPIGIHFGSEIDPEEAGGRKLFPKVIEAAVRDQYSELHRVLSIRS